MQRIGIIGCGWLGLPLAEMLSQKGYEVVGSTATPSKIGMLRQAGIQPFLLNISSDKVVGNLDQLLSGIDTLVLNLPPGLRRQPNESFIDKIKLLVPFILGAGVSHLLFVSSTSVYGNLTGTITEDTPPSPSTESGRQLWVVEQLLGETVGFDLTVLRFGGLIGGQRHPIKQLSGKKELPDPHAPINFIHREDCIGIIENIIAQDSWNALYNGVTPYHPTRMEYYTSMAKIYGLDPPSFSTDKGTEGKLVTSDRLLTSLAYRFKLNNLLIKE